MSSENNIQNQFSFKKLLIPIAISVLACVLIFKLFDSEKSLWEIIQSLHFTLQSCVWLSLAIIAHCLRDLMYMWRLRVLSDKKITWRNSFDVIMLWETASSITPSSAGGSGFAMFIINREGISFGKSTSMLIVTVLLDKIYYVLILPILLLILGEWDIFPPSMNLISGFEYYLWAGYFVLLFLTILLYYGLFINPQLLKRLIVKPFFALPFLRRFRRKAAKTGVEIEIASQELIKKPFSFFLEAFTATFLSWTFRFLVLNFIFLAFIPDFDQIIIFCRQLLTWLIMLLPLSPGSSGIAEYAFMEVMSDVSSKEIIFALILLWRGITFYPYLVIGIIVFPKWLKRTDSITSHE